MISFVLLSGQATLNPFIGSWEMTSNDPVVDHIMSAKANKEKIIVTFSPSLLTTTVGGVVQEEIEISFQLYNDRWYICDTAAYNCELLYMSDSGEYVTIPMDRLLTGKRLILRKVS
jgi:hypothetical protein